MSYFMLVCACIYFGMFAAIISGANLSHVVQAAACFSAGCSAVALAISFSQDRP